MFQLVGLKKGIIRHTPCSTDVSWEEAKRECTYVSIKKTQVFITST
ncbi:hypothetical protein AGRO_1980 [Agrobacterium sp. ATCC 31749]|nr:hypothetical protein AGRO_1980 [Agrobacterium sp. ATCC 31749]